MTYLRRLLRGFRELMQVECITCYMLATILEEEGKGGRRGEGEEGGGRGDLEHKFRDSLLQSYFEEFER